MPTIFQFLKIVHQKYTTFYVGTLSIYIVSPDLHEFAAARMQNLYARSSSALCSLSVTLMHAEHVSAEIIQKVMQKV
jgi:hypothetical protein